MCVVLKQRTHAYKHINPWHWSKQNEVTPYWFKIEEFSAALSNKFSSKHWKPGEMFDKVLFKK